ncbi:doublecortin domain-containing protein 2-like isoform X9 [Bolinopsis microptera]|uniref:doublecortin domain-containing protein 2-like isoform X9 n=1 Tax=Bolinopsis microptera TaxID=2820187 RepID=UPI003079741D
MALSVDTTPAKHVTVLRNGDGKYEGRKFVVSRRRYRTFDALLSDITHQISAPFGAVRRLYTPKGSRQVLGIDDLEGGATYVAGGSERFKKINYNPQLSPGKNWGFTAKIKPGFLADDPPPLVLPKKNKKYAQRSAQFHKVRQPVQFTVFRNGLPSDKGTRFLLKAREMKSFETVLSIISFKIRLVEGAVRRLFTLEGGILHGPEDVVDGGIYVACGHRRFIAASYGELNQPAKTQKLPSIKRRKDISQPSPRTQSNPLPAIQKKAAEKKARSEKDSPAPIEEDKDEFIAHKEDDHVDAIVNGDAENDVEQNSSGDAGDVDTEKVGEVISRTDAVDTAIVGQAISDTVDTDDVDGDISATEISSVPSKSRSKLPVPKKSNQAVSSGELTDGGTSEAESETDFISEKGKITPRKFSPYEQAFHDDKLEGYTEILDKPLKTSDVLDDTAPNVYPEVFSRGSTLADSNPSDEDVLEGELTDGETTEAQYEADFMSDNGEITPPRLSPFEQVFQDDEIEEYTEILDEPLETPDVLDGTAQNVYPEVSPRGTSPADEEIFEGELTDGETTEAQYEADFMSDNGEITPPRLSPFEQVFQDDEIEEYTEIRDEPLETPDVLDDTAPNVYPEVSPRGTTPADEEIFEGELTGGETETPEAEFGTNIIPENGGLTPRSLSPFEQSSQDDEPLKTRDVMEDKAPNVYPEVFSKPHTPVRSNYSYSNSDNYSNSDEDVLEDEIKNVPSKSKLDRNPPQKKGNPELLANGTNDSVFNATAAAKPTNQDGQFLMNNVDEGETNGHEDVEEIEEDGELIEDKPIDLQHAEEIPDETLNQSRRRSVSSSK